MAKRRRQSDRAFRIEVLAATNVMLTAVVELYMMAIVKAKNGDVINYRERMRDGRDGVDAFKMLLSTQNHYCDYITVIGDKIIVIAYDEYGLFLRFRNRTESLRNDECNTDSKLKNTLICKLLQLFLFRSPSLVLPGLDDS